MMTMDPMRHTAATMAIAATMWRKIFWLGVRTEENMIRKRVARPMRGSGMGLGFGGVGPGSRSPERKNLARVKRIWPPSLAKVTRLVKRMKARAPARAPRDATAVRMRRKMKAALAIGAL